MGVSKAQVSVGKTIEPGLNLRLGVSLNALFSVASIHSCSSPSITAIRLINRRPSFWVKEHLASLSICYLGCFRSTFIFDTEHRYPFLSFPKNLESKTSSDLYLPLLLVRAVVIVTFSSFCNLLRSLRRRWPLQFSSHCSITKHTVRQPFFFLVKIEFCVYISHFVGTMRL